jgi:hypothetical protein
MTKDIKQGWQHGRVGSNEFYNQHLCQVIGGLVAKKSKILALIASDCGGNKRAVTVSKRSAHISQGFRPNYNSKQFDMAWRSWSFKSNFMFKLVI